jgi:predicted glycosyltransferase
LKGLPEGNWKAEHTKALIELSTDSQLILVLPDVLDILNEQQRDKNQNTLAFIRRFR